MGEDLHSVAPDSPRTSEREGWEEYKASDNDEEEGPSQGNGPRYSLERTTSKVDRGTMADIRQYMRDQEIRLSSFLNSLGKTDSPILQDEVRSWLTSKPAGNLLKKWKHREEWAQKVVGKLVDAEAEGVIKSRTLHLGKKDLTNANVTEVTFDALVDVMNTRVPVTQEVLRALIGPDPVPKEDAPGPSTAPVRGSKRRRLEGMDDDGTPRAASGAQQASPTRDGESFDEDDRQDDEDDRQEGDEEDEEEFEDEADAEDHGFAPSKKSMRPLRLRKKPYVSH